MLIECNRCKYEELKTLAKRRRHLISMRVRNGGIDVYVHPPRDDPEKWWCAWLASLPPYCVCGEG